MNTFMLISFMTYDNMDWFNVHISYVSFITLVIIKTLIAKRNLETFLGVIII
jgi:hypothetical protein